MSRQRERRRMKALLGVTLFASVQVRRRGELAFMSILMTVRAKCKLNFEEGSFACGEVTLGAVDLGVRFA